MSLLQLPIHQMLADRLLCCNQPCVLEKHQLPAPLPTGGDVRLGGTRMAYKVSGRAQTAGD